MDYRDDLKVVPKWEHPGFVVIKMHHAIPAGLTPTLSHTQYLPFTGKYIYIYLLCVYACILCDFLNNVQSLSQTLVFILWIQATLVWLLLTFKCIRLSQRVTVVVCVKNRAVCVSVLEFEKEFMHYVLCSCMQYKPTG